MIWDKPLKGGSIISSKHGAKKNENAMAMLNIK